MPVANIVVRAGKAYVQAMAAMEGEGRGAYLAVEPVRVTEPTVEGLAETLRWVLSRGDLRVPTPRSRADLPHPDPLLKAAGVRSWLALARGAASYDVSWQADGIELCMSQHDKRGRFVEDPTKTRILPPATDARVIAELIVEDLRSRPDVLGSQT